MMAKKNGRPTKYKEEYAKQAYGLCLLGHIDEELAVFFEVDVATIHRWKLSHPDFCDAIKEGKEIADENVVKSLYHRATGYDHEDIYFSSHKGIVTETPYTKHYPPDPTSMIFWLKNRQKAKWRDRHEVTGKDGEPIKTETKYLVEFVPTKKDENKAD